MSELGGDWRLLGGVATAWFDAPSLLEGAALAGRLSVVSPAIALDLRASGVRVRLESPGHAATVSAAARELGLAADPAVLQDLGLVLETELVRDAAVEEFWQGVLGYEPGEHHTLVDPWQRDPALRVRRSSEHRPERNRIHLDVVRPAAVVERVRPGAASGPYGACHADADGNEVDLVPGAPLGTGGGTSDWQTVFSAIACYRTTSPGQQRALAAAAAELAVGAGFPLLIDLRPGVVVLDTGKDQWEQDAHGLGLDFTELAGALQEAARRLGASADPELPRFVQLFLDAADVAAVRAFWAAALGYSEDRRTGLTDIHDPRRLNPVLALQELDPSETQRRRQRNRIHLELVVPVELARTRVDAAVAAGGHVLEESPDRWRVADPEGNEVVMVSESTAPSRSGSRGPQLVVEPMTRDQVLDMRGSGIEVAQEDLGAPWVSDE